MGDDLTALPLREFVFIKEAAKYLKVTPHWVSTLLDQGQIHGVFYFGRKFVHWPSVEMYVARQIAGQTPKRGRPRKVVTVG